MNNILYVAGKPYGCDIAIVEKQQFKIVRSSYKATEFIFKLSKIHFRPAKEMIQMIGDTYKFSQKVPILIENNQFLFFPTISMKDKECCWINYYCIFCLRRMQNGTKVFFKEYSVGMPKPFKTYVVPFELDKRIFVNQMKRCMMIHEEYNQQNIRVKELIYSEMIS